MSKYVFLVSDGKRLSVTLDKPLKLRLGKKHWKERFRYRIGEALTVYTDDPWVGTVGVFDLSNDLHITAFADAVRDHTLSLAERRIEGKLHEIFGKEASDDVRKFGWGMDPRQRRKHMWTPFGGLLWRTSQALKEVCFQNR